MSETFGIGVLAERTGLSQGQLRTWGARFGFPEGRRADNGHRRFTDVDVDRVERVLAAHEGGLPLALAIESVTTADRLAAKPTVFGTLIESFPHLRHDQLGRGPLVRLSRAIEDECLARHEGAIVLGAFQSGTNFADSVPRWQELARTASWCAVVADFGRQPPARPTGPDVPPGPDLADLPPDAPMRREWTVVTLGDTHSAVLSAWELPGRSTRRRFEAVMSVQPVVALTAARVMTGVLRAGSVEVPAAVERRIAEPPPPPHHNSADRQLARAVSYLSPKDDR